MFSNLQISDTEIHFPQIIMTVGIISAVCLLIAAFSIQTKIDFSTCFMFCLVIMVVAVIFGIILMFGMVSYLHMAYCGVGIIGFSFYMIIDTQMMMGGSGRRYTVHPEDYIFCCLELYIDITSLMFFVLQMFIPGKAE